MRVAILSESSADETALRILVNAVLRVKTNPIDNLSLRSRNWQTVKEVLTANAKMLHYRTNADALVVVVDSNHTYLSPGKRENRLSDFQELLERCKEQLGPVSGRVPLKIAIGVAAPAIEAWWLCKTDPQITEAAWEKGLDEKRDPYSKLELKRRLYGREYNSLDWMTQKMVEAARNLENDLALLERNFPNGFGALAKELRGWRKLN
jgi:hypothetical protein